MRTNISARSEWPEGMRPCKLCNVVKLYTEFHKHKGLPFGVNNVCKICRKPIAKQSQKEIPNEYKMFHAAKNRAKKKGVTFNIEVSDIIIPSVCPILGIPLVKGEYKAAPSLDRIIPELGYVKGNVWVISNQANMMKGEASVEELKTFAKWAMEL